MDIADDITYSVHDLDDCYRAGILPLNELISIKAERAKFLEYCCEKIDLDENDQSTDDVRLAFTDILAICPPEFQTPFRGTIKEQGSQVMFISQMIGMFARSFQIYEAKGTYTVTLPPRIKLSIKILKRMMFYYVYKHPSLAAQQHGERRILKDLFEIVYDAIASSENRNILAPRYQSRVQREIDRASKTPGLVLERLYARLTADGISSLSESEAIAFHHCPSGVSHERMTQPLGL